jgi:light-regulated signal transduction histidine kinase (bacteriophytochrome)
MKSETLAKLHSFCADEAAFEQLQQILAEDVVAPIVTAVDGENMTDTTSPIQFQLEQRKALMQVITRLRGRLDLETIFRETAIEVRQLLKVDRVGMYQFDPDSGWNDGEFVSEDVDAAFSSAMEQKIHDRCFGDQFAVHYEQGRIQAVADIYTAGLSDCHIKILAQFQVRANLIVPLLLGEKLWGLLCIHCCQAPRQWTEIEIEFATQIASHLGMAIQQAQLLADLRAEVVEREQAEERTRSSNQELRQAIVELKAVNQELEAFSYAVSHDLRAPLRSIDGFSQALLEDYGITLDPNGQDFLRRIRAATQKMGQLIDDLLKLSRVTRIDINREVVNLSSIADRIRTELQQNQPERLVEFVIPPQLCTRGDAHLLHLVLENLLNNAWKFTAKQPNARIEVGVVTDDRNSSYFVRDNGVGFDPVYTHKLFVPFQRLHDSHDFPGNGIGLATVQRIVRRHGGIVWAEGNIGQGARFNFTLTEGVVRS